MSDFDPRITLIHQGLAARSLEGMVAAERYIDPTPMQATAPVAAIRAAPRQDATQISQLLFGERFDVLFEVEGFAFGQCARDLYVGFVAATALAAPLETPSHRVSAIRTYAFAEPDIKAPIIGLYSLNSLVTAGRRQGRFVEASRGGWFVEDHLAPVGRLETDMSDVAERFLGAPYQWGGRESLGLDCSGLVQAALLACGRACPRDSDQQLALGAAVSRDALRRGDLVGWKGHIAIMLDEARIIHANAHHMATTIEPLDGAIERIGAAGVGAPLTYRRL